MKRNQRTGLAKLAFSFFTIGIVNLFADLTTKGLAASPDPFLGSLGARKRIGIVVGFGELLGYELVLLRLSSGR